MRILSQDGLYKSGNVDLPYEMCALSMGYTGNESKICIYAHFNGTKGQKIAEYSTEVKARKAVEMLREAYSPVLVIKEHQEGLKPNIKPNDWFLTPILPTQRAEAVDNFYFQFPSDDEVEV